MVRFYVSINTTINNQFSDSTIAPVQNSLFEIYVLLHIPQNVTQ